MRLIDADELYKELEGFRMVYIDEDSMTSEFATDVIETVQDEYLAKSMTVDAAPVRHGRWEKVGYACGETEWQCSDCKETEWRTSIDRIKYCPFCGAKMDLEV